MAKLTLEQLNARLKEARAAAAEKNARQEFALEDGLRVRVNASGSASFSYRYRAPGTNSLRTITLRPIGDKVLSADLKEAQAAHRQAKSERLAAEDPATKREEARAAAAEQAAAKARDRADKSFTVRRLAHAYIDSISQEGTDRFRVSWKDQAWLLERHIVAELGDKPASRLTVADCANVLKLIEDTPVLRNRVLAAGSASWNWAIKESARRQLKINGREVQLPTLNPWSMETRFTEKPRDRVLSVKELRTLLRVIREASPNSAADAVHLTLLTGVRKSEAANARREEFDLENGTWTVPPSRMKANNEHIVLLSDQAKALVERVLASHAEDHLFPSPMYPGQPCNHQHGWRWLNENVLPETQTSFHLHDLRRSFATWAGEALNSDGMPKYGDAVIDRCLAHAKRGTIRHYNVARLREPARRLWSEWASYLDGLLDEKVTPIGKVS